MYESGILNCPTEFKMEEEDHDKGVFVGYGSYFGNKDQGNDVVQSGAFAKSISKNPAVVTQLKACTVKLAM